MTKFLRLGFFCAVLVALLCACSPVSTLPGAASTAPTPEPMPIPGIENKYFLSQLSGEELEFCELAYAGIMDFQESVDVSAAEGVSFERARALIRALLDDCPELYMCTGDYTLRGTDSVSELEFSCHMSLEEYLAAADELEQRMAVWQAELSGKSDYEKALYIYTTIADNCEYSAEGRYEDTAYGAMIEGKAQCQGYSRAFQLAMQSLGMRCLFVSSEEMAHGWNLVELDGCFYQLDLTWDDSGDVGTCVYFNMDDELAARLGHVYDRSEGWTYPVCSSMELNYYAKNELLLAAGADIKAAFMDGLSTAFSAGGGRVTLMLEEAEQLAELTEKQKDWIMEWNEARGLGVSYTRIIPEDNDYVYIADFSFE